jgi:membrane complex biogenesis BtpA family protein
MGRLRFGTGGRLVVGMVHLQPLPGTPFHRAGSLDEIVRTAVDSARALDAGGADGCLVQTVDRVHPTGDEADPARTAAMALIVRAVADATRPEFAVGAQIMRNAIRASLAVAKTAGGSFVRAGALVGATLTAHGPVAANPEAVMAYRARIDAWDVAVVADVDSGQFRWAGERDHAGVAAHAAQVVGADAVAVGHPDPDRALAAVAAVRAAAPGLPVLLAGHTDHGNAGRLLAEADGAFVGTCLEEGGWGGRVDVERVRSYVQVVRGLEPRG